MIQNRQQQEPKEKASGDILEIVSVFHTLQGEGPFTGEAAIFIRLAGCNLQCPWCDTDYTTDRRKVGINELASDKIEQLLILHPATKLIVITGGEPLRQDIVPLIKLLFKRFGVHVQIESNGVFPPSTYLTDLIRQGIVTYIVSPKTSRISATAEQWATAYKYVLSADSLMSEDGLPRHALGHPAHPFIARPQSDFRGTIYINPCDNQDPEINKANLIACRNSALKFGYKMGIQLHKLVDLP